MKKIITDVDVDKKKVFVRADFNVPLDENGVITDDPGLLKPLETQFDDIWRGAFCESCDRRDYCGDCPV